MSSWQTLFPKTEAKGVLKPLTMDSLHPRCPGVHGWVSLAGVSRAGAHQITRVCHV